MIFDAHADILTDLYQQKEKGHNESFRSRHLDDYIRSGITHSIFVNWTDPNTDDLSLFDKIFDNAFKEFDNMQDIFHIIKSSNDMSLSTHNGKIGVLIGMEGIGQLRNVSHLHELYRKGVRHASLTWNDVNRYSGGLSSETDGLTLLGREILDEMQSLGMIVDLAHSNAISFNQILEHTTGPIIISHGNCKALCNHIRNYTDDQLLAVKDRNGVVGICAIAPFLANDKELQSVQTMAKHIDYAIKLIGIDHVGVGFDICYYLYENVTSNHVDGFMSIADAENVFVELAKMGYNEEEINKIKFGNFSRIVKTVLG